MDMLLFSLEKTEFPFFEFPYFQVFVPLPPQEPTSVSVCLSSITMDSLNCDKGFIASHNTPTGLEPPSWPDPPPGSHPPSRSRGLFRCTLSRRGLFRPRATVSRISLMESGTCRRCRGGPPPWHENVMDGWGAQPLRPLHTKHQGQLMAMFPCIFGIIQRQC